MNHFVYDIECNGFLDEVTLVHSLVIGDLMTDEIHSFNPFEIEEGIKLLQTADLRIGHNSIKFDDAVINKVYGVELKPSAALDTLILSRMIHGNLMQEDYQNRLPNDVRKGSHSLKAWGVRLGLHKIDYQGGFDQWTPEMQEYCRHDVRVTMRLYRHLMKAKPPQDAIDTEMEFATLIARMEREGMPFDVAGATKLYQDLAQKRANIKHSLDALFPPWVESTTFIPKRDNKTLGYKKGIPVVKRKTIDFNPSSRQHISKCLINKYGWKPKNFTDGGQPKIDEEILDQLAFPEAKVLAESFMLDKRIGALAEGDNSWLNREVNGKIHANYNTLGTITARTNCSKPNIQQVPASSKPWGKECRELFYAPEGWVMLGTDMSGLELRCLAHYMSFYDDGVYAKQVVDGDVHTLNQQAAGLPTRDNAKTFIYAFLYGAGDAKIGSIVGGSAARGKQLKEQFLDGVPALKKLKDHVSSGAKKGYLKTIDQRHIPIRHQHAALNSLLQSSGGIVCKKWVLIADELLKREGFAGNYKFIASIHDEAQLLVKPEVAEDVGRIFVRSARETGDYYNFACPLTADYKIGNNWSETH